MSEPSYLESKEELNVYLVSRDLKPAATIEMRPAIPMYRPFAEEEFDYDLQDNVMVLSPDFLRAFDSDLVRRKIQYCHRNEDQLFSHNMHDDDDNFVENILMKGVSFFIGSTAENLSRLREAQSDLETGLALGYPLEAVQAYNTRQKGGQRDAHFFMALVKARLAQIQIPDWLAYISHAPEQLDLVSGDVSPSSKALGERYMDHVRRHNPTLATKVESNFPNQQLLDVLEKHYLDNC
jgi:hypothetical protein